MQLRPMTPSDLSLLDEIDATIESTRYLHVERSGEALSMTWQLHDRPLREKLIDPTRLSDEVRFLARQISTGADEGLCIVAEYDGDIIAMLVAQPDPANQTFALRDLRVDYDYRRQGIGMAMIYQLIQAARDQGFRAVSAESKTNNPAAAHLLSKCGFDLSGLDTHRSSNHDLVKEAVTLLWYAALD